MHRSPFANELEVSLGLKLIPNTDRDPDAHEYWVLSPTGIRLFRVGSWGDGAKIGMVSTPDMYELGQENAQ